MAYQTGNIKYRGSFKSIRQWKNSKDPKIYAGEKGGANRDLILNNPAFARTRENMSEFKGCGMAVKAIRKGLYKLIPEHTDAHFTGRLVALVKMINQRDFEGIHGTREISISKNSEILRTMTFHVKKKIDLELRKCISASHSESRTEATITVDGLNPNPLLVPGNAQYYRVINHLNIVSDYVYNKEEKKYKPLSLLNSLSVIAYSDYIPVNTPLTSGLNASFPEGTLLTNSDTVLQCVGIEFYITSVADTYCRYSGASMLVFDVF